MDDIPRHVRRANAHEPNNLVGGHFGLPKYRDKDGSWHFLRNDGLSSEKNDGVTLDLLSWRVSESPGDNRLPTEGHLEKVFAKRNAVKLVLQEATSTDTKTEGFRSQAAEDGFGQNIVHGYAITLVNRNSHPQHIPVMVNVSETKPTEIEVRRLKVEDIDRVDSDAVIAPVYGQRVRLNAPFRERIRWLRFTLDGRSLLLFQNNVTSLGRLVIGAETYDEDEDNRLTITLDIQMTLPTSVTGSHPHVGLAFHPTNQLLTAVVDSGGTWSTWQVKTKTGALARLHHKIALVASGRLNSSGNNIVSLDRRSPRPEKWHWILILTARGSQRSALLVCDRRSGHLFSLGGLPKGQVDLRLGSVAARNELLHVEPSTCDKHVCYMLTTSRLMVMRLRAVGTDDFDTELLCSWPHHFGRGAAEPRLHVADSLIGKWLTTWASSEC
jgi:hypothetical protein